MSPASFRDCQRTSQREFRALPPPINGSQTKRDPRKGAIRGSREPVGGQVKRDHKSAPLGERSGNLSEVSNSNSEQRVVQLASSQPTESVARPLRPVIPLQALPRDQDITELDALKRYNEATQATGSDRTYPGTTVSPNIEPPITSTMLSMLKISKLVNRVTLHHNLNFERDLDLKQMIGAAEMMAKSQKTEAFWCFMAVQLHNYLSDPDKFMRAHSESEWTISATLKEIPKLLKNLALRHEILAVEESFVWLASNMVSDLAKVASKIDITTAHAWYEMTKTLQQPYFPSHEPIWNFLTGLIKLAMPGYRSVYHRCLYFAKSD